MSPVKYNKMFGWRGWAGGETPTPLMTVDVDDMVCPVGGDAYPERIQKSLKKTCRPEGRSPKYCILHFPVSLWPCCTKYSCYCRNTIILGSRARDFFGRAPYTHWLSG